MFLYRYFTEKEYAEKFMNSEFRVLNLPEYQKIEDPTRRDINDGLTSFPAWIDRNKISINGNPALTEFEKPPGMADDAIFTSSNSSTVSWQWHALCLSFQCNKKIAERFKNSKYVVGFHINDLIAILENSRYWKRILEYRGQPILYCENKDFINNYYTNFFKLKSGEINPGEFMIFRDCFVKNMDFYDEHEFRILIMIEGNTDPQNPIKEFYFQDKRKIESATLIEL